MTETHNDSPTAPRGSQSIVTKRKAPLDRNEIKNLLDRYRSQIAAALPKHITPDRLIRVALTAISRNPKLRECTAGSLIGSIVQASQLGLEPDSPLGHGYLVPFYNEKKKCHEVQFVPGFRGYIDLAQRSGRVQSFMAQVVREGDVFEYEFGLNDKLRHVPSMGERGEITHAYAYARFTNGGYVFEVLPRADIDAVMNKSKSKDKDGKISGPWKTNYEPMARKTMVRRLAKYVPLSVEFARAVALDEVALRGQSQNLDVANIDKDTGEIAESEFSVLSEEEEGTSSDAMHATDAKQKNESMLGRGQQT